MEGKSARTGIISMFDGAGGCLHLRHSITSSVILHIAYVITNLLGYFVSSAIKSKSGGKLAISMAKKIIVRESGVCDEIYLLTWLLCALVV